MTMITLARPNRKVSRVFIHCSASDHRHHDNIETIRAWHTNPKPKKGEKPGPEHGRSWSDVGYHYFIRKSGLIEEGRPLSKSPAAQKGHNTGTIAICCHGLEEDRFTEAQFNSLRQLCAQINEAYGGAVTFHGHREVSNKTCPVFNYRLVLGLDGQGRMTGFEPKNQAAPAEPAAPYKSPHHKPKIKSKTLWSVFAQKLSLGSVAAGVAQVDGLSFEMKIFVMAVLAIVAGFGILIAWERYKKWQRGE